MRIVYVLTQLGVGGAERQVLALAERMAARGHTVALLVLRPQLADGLQTELDVFYLDMHRTPASVLGGFARGVGFVRAYRPHLIHSHNVHGNLVARMLRIFYPAAALVSTIHNVYEGGWTRMLAYRLTDPLSSQSTAVCEAAAVRYVRIGAVPKRKCIVIANGIDTAEFAPDTARRATTRRQMTVKDEFVWLTAGRIVPAKDYPNLLRAFAEARAGAPGAQLWIAADANGPEAKAVKKLAGQLGLQDEVRWLGLRNDMPALLDGADGFVLGSAWEGMPMALGEAMAMEKPIVATDVGGVRELVGKMGTIVQSKDNVALAEAMLAVMRTPAAQRRLLGRAAHMRIAISFSMDAKAEEWESLYNSLLNKSK